MVDILKKIRSGVNVCSKLSCELTCGEFCISYSCVCDVPHSSVCHMPHLCVCGIPYSCVCDMPHSCVYGKTESSMRHGSFICVWHDHSCAWHDSFTYVECDVFICVTWLMHHVCCKTDTCARHWWHVQHLRVYGVRFEDSGLWLRG